MGYNLLQWTQTHRTTHGQMNLSKNIPKQWRWCNGVVNIYLEHFGLLDNSPKLLDAIDSLSFCSPYL